MRPPAADPMQIAFLVYLIDASECRQQEWNDRKAVQVAVPGTDGGLALPQGQLARWLLAAKIGSVFGIHDPKSGETCETGRRSSGGKHRLSCDLLQQYLTLSAAIEGVRSAYAADDVASAHEELEVLELSKRLLESPAPEALESANTALVQSAAAVAFYGNSHEKNLLFARLFVEGVTGGHGTSRLATQSSSSLL